ncbi:MAG: glycosyltransferase family 2 protein [Lachnospiraceae bacterium]|nr:glycosyltransferase family 2 protein [Lachnospiraceae bacterium]
MRKKGFISVIVPVYNVEKYVERCVESIIRQTYDKLQIILVDDGSKDKSGLICDNLAQRDERISVLHKNWGGLADTRNVGLAFAVGEYISFIDSDDYIQDTMLEDMVRAIVRHSCDIAICGRYDVFEENFRTRKSFCLTEERIFEGEGLLREYFKGSGVEQSSCCDKVFHYRVVEKLRFPTGKTSEDVYFTYAAFNNAKRAVHVGKPLYYYWHRKGSITAKVPIDKTELDVMGLMKKIERELWREGRFFILKAFYSFYMSAFITLYEEVRKSAEVDKSFEKYRIWLKTEALVRIVFLLVNSYILPERKWIFIKMLLDV